MVIADYGVLKRVILEPAMAGRSGFFEYKNEQNTRGVWYR
jgi:hypothetical protein